MMYQSDAKVLALCKKMQMVEGDYFVVSDGMKSAIVPDMILRM